MQMLTHNPLLVLPALMPQSRCASNLDWRTGDTEQAFHSPKFAPIGLLVYVFSAVLSQACAMLQPPWQHGYSLL